MKSIFNISEEYLELISKIEEQEGELTPELEEQLKINAHELEIKLKSYHHVIQTIKGQVSTINDELTRLKTLRDQKLNLVERLKGAVLDATLIFGEDGKSGNKKLKYDTLNIYTVNKKVLEINNPETLSLDLTRNMVTNNFTPDELHKIRTIVKDLDVISTPDKDKIKGHLLAGEEIDNVQLVIKPHVVIK